MSDVWNKMIGELSNLSDTIAEKSEEYFKIAVEKGEELSKKGKLQLEIESSKRELKRELIQFGEFVFTKNHEENVSDFSINDQFQEHTEKILNIKKVIASLEEEKHNLSKKTVAENEPIVDNNSNENSDNSSSDQMDFKL